MLNDILINGFQIGLSKYMSAHVLNDFIEWYQKQGKVFQKSNDGDIPVDILLSNLHSYGPIYLTSATEVTDDFGNTGFYITVEKSAINVSANNPNAPVFVSFKGSHYMLVDDYSDGEVVKYVKIKQTNLTKNYFLSGQEDFVAETAGVWLGNVAGFHTGYSLGTKILFILPAFGDRPSKNIMLKITSAQPKFKMRDPFTNEIVEDSMFYYTVVPHTWDIVNDTTFIYDSRLEGMDGMYDLLSGQEIKEPNIQDAVQYVPYLMYKNLMSKNKSSNQLAFGIMQTGLDVPEIKAPTSKASEFDITDNSKKVKQSKDGDYIEYENVVENETVKVSALPTYEVPTDINESVSNSGGADGADIEFDRIGKRFGRTKNLHFYIDNETNLPPYRDTPITDPNFIEEGSKEATKAAQVTYGFKGKIVNPLLIRNWAQVKYSDVVIAVSTFAETGERLFPNSRNPEENRKALRKSVTGGTGYAVQMAINHNKPVYVFDQKNEKWFKYEYSSKKWMESEVPILGKRFAGIGTQRINEVGKKAIADVHKKTLAFIELSTKQTTQSADSNDKLTTIKWENGKKSYVFYVVSGEFVSGTFKDFGRLEAELTLEMGQQAYQEYLGKSNNKVNYNLLFDYETNKSNTTDVNVEEVQVKKIVVPEGSSKDNLVIKEDSKFIYLMNDEQQQAYNKLKAFLLDKFSSPKKVYKEDGKKKEFKDGLGSTYSDLIPEEMWENSFALVGKGGTGKTTLIKKIIDDIQKEYRYARFTYLAPTHNACVQLQESLGYDSDFPGSGNVNTFASFLMKVPVSKEQYKLKTEQDYIKYANTRKYSIQNTDVYIIDEASFIDKEFINDLMIRMDQESKVYTDLSYPIFIFMGDFRQLSMGENTDKKEDYNEGVISATLFNDKNKVVSLSQIMRSSEQDLHTLYDSVGEEIVKARTSKSQNKKVEPFDNSKYKKLRKTNTSNVGYFKYEEQLIDYYAQVLLSDINPEKMIWIHFNKLTNQNTIILSKSIRKKYFELLNLPIISDDKIQKHDYIRYKGAIAMKALNTNGGEVILRPQSRIKVVEIKEEKANISFIINDPIILEEFDKNTEVTVNVLYFLDRKGRINKKVISGSDYVNVKFEKKGTKSVMVYTLKNKKGDIIHQPVEIAYSRVLDDDGNERSVAIKPIEDDFFLDYVISSHSIQGAAADIVIAGLSNVFQNNEAVGDSKMAQSWYTIMTRARKQILVLDSQTTESSMKPFALYDDLVSKGIIKERKVMGEKEIVASKTDVAYNRETVSKDIETLYIFTDNGDRTSGSKSIDKNSEYFKKFGADEDLFYPTQTQAVIRGLNNAFPISTLKFYAKKQFGSNSNDALNKSQWTDEDFDLFKSTIDAEIQFIKDALVSGKYKSVKFSGTIGVGTFSNIKKNSSKSFDYLNKKLLEIGIDNQIVDTNNQATDPSVNFHSQSNDFLGKALTNKTYGKYQIYSVPGLKIPDGTTEDKYSAEAWYLNNKSNADTEVQRLKEDIMTMTNIIAMKFRLYPELFSELQKRGGESYIESSQHTVGNKNSRWEGKGMGSNFLVALNSAYKNEVKKAQITEALLNNSEVLQYLINNPIFQNFAVGKEFDEFVYETKQSGATSMSMIKDRSRTQTSRSSSELQKIQKIIDKQKEMLNNDVNSVNFGYLLYMKNNEGQGSFVRVLSNPFEINELSFKNYEGWADSVWEGNSAKYNKKNYKSILFEIVKPKTPFVGARVSKDGKPLLVLYMNNDTIRVLGGTGVNEINKKNVTILEDNYSKLVSFENKDYLITQLKKVIDVSDGAVVKGQLETNIIDISEIEYKDPNCK
jgi:hypothetical protein